VTKLSPLPELEVAKVRRYCEERIPAHLRNQLLLEVGTRGPSITIFELRPPWRRGFGKEWTRREIAQMRYDPEASTFTLYWADRNGRWLEYPEIEPANSVEPLLREIDRNPSGAFD